MSSDTNSRGSDSVNMSAQPTTAHVGARERAVRSSDTVDSMAASAQMVTALIANCNALVVDRLTMRVMRIHMAATDATTNKEDRR